MKLYAYNNTPHTIKSYSIAHSWDGETQTLNGSDLASKKRSTPIEITTGYTEHDWYTIIVEIDSIGGKSTDFYCDSSQIHKSAEISFHETYVNCNYYTSDTPSKDSHEDDCKHKSYR